MTHDAIWFIDNGCELVSPSLEIFLGVMRLSNGNPCRECNCKDTCPAWPKIAAEQNVKTPRASSATLCSQCRSPLNMAKVERRGGRCACGAKISIEKREFQD